MNQTTRVEENIKFWNKDSLSYSFENVLDSACERLWEIHIQYSIQRIKKMNDDLLILEKELDEILSR